MNNNVETNNLTYKPKKRKKNLCNKKSELQLTRLLNKRSKIEFIVNYLGGIDFMLLSGSSNTLGQASGVTEI